MLRLQLRVEDLKVRPLPGMHVTITGTRLLASCVGRNGRATSCQAGSDGCCPWEHRAADGNAFSRGRMSQRAF